VELTAEQWRTFFTIASRHIRGTLKSEVNEPTAPLRADFIKSYCAWTSHDRLGYDTLYWTLPLPVEKDLQENGLRDGGMWREPIPYNDIAHVIIPAEYTEDYHVDEKWIFWSHTQDIAGLSKLLDEASIPHKLHETFLELKLY
jgi:hypothetical protein